MAKSESNGQAVEGIVPLLNTAQASEYIGCTARYLQRMVRGGRLRALKPTGKLVRFRLRDLDAFLESGSSLDGAK